MKRMGLALGLAAATTFVAAVLFAVAMLSTRSFALERTPRATPREQTYADYCEACHGANGDGRGPSAEGMRPAPRDFTRGEFKFTRTGYGTLPSDAALKHTIRHGLDGTPMQGWDLTDAELDAVVAQVKSFSPRWKEEVVPVELEVSADSWSGRAAEAVAAGERAYHALGCASCHPSYAPPSLERVSLKDGTYGQKVLPISFTLHRLKSGRTREDVYRVVASGVSGAAMPGWKGMISEEQLWALAYYVESLSTRSR
jgi:mono/diheme cytochrome c family protein